MLGNYLQQTTSADDIFRCIFFLALWVLSHFQHTWVPSATLTGFKSSDDAFSKQFASGPCGVIILWRVAPPGKNPPSCFRRNIISAAAWDFQQFDILTSVDSDEPLQPPFKLRNSKWCSVSSFSIIEYSSDQQRLWSDCAYAQAGLRLCWSHIQHCWKSHALAQLFYHCSFSLV